MGAVLDRLFGRSAARPTARSASAKPSPHRCPLCGSSFTDEEAAACATCPIARRCGLVMCPRCSYEFPPAG